MKVKFLCPYWGSEHLGVGKFLDRVIAEGYDGVEIYLDYKDEKGSWNTLEEIRQRDLLYVVQHGQSADSDYQAYKNEFELSLQFLADTAPLFINSQTGVDYFAFERNVALIEIAESIAEASGIGIKHEIHRGKFGFAAHVTRAYLEQIPNLRITADFSHWVNVAESMLEDQPEGVALAIARADHIHARIGFPEGPQIPDPRASEWQETMAYYLRWWDRIIEKATKAGEDFFTITPEFGPVPYMTILPQTGEPISDQWDLNVYMKTILAERYHVSVADG